MLDVNTDGNTQVPNLKKPVKPIWEKWWFWVAIVLVLFVVGSALGNSSDSASNDSGAELKSIKLSYTGSTEDGTEVKLSDIVVTGTYSDGKTAKLSDCSLENPAALVVDQVTTFNVECGKIKSSLDVTGTVKISQEYKNALKSAESYSKTLHMSKADIFDQLTSEYGDQFPEDAAQYAVDNVDADWNANALEKARSYQKTMHMSKNAIYDQLISEYGEKFTPEQAQYAIDNLED